MPDMKVSMVTKLTTVKYRSREDYEAGRPYEEKTTIHQDTPARRRS